MVGSITQGTAAAGVRSATNPLNVSSTSNSLVIPVADFATLGVTFTGLAASGATLVYSASNDSGVSYDPGLQSFNASTGVPSTSRTIDGGTRFDVGGRTHVKIGVSVAGTGSINIAYNAEPDSTLIVSTAPIPPGANRIGSTDNGVDEVDRSGTTNATAGTFEAGTVTTATGTIAANTARQFLRVTNKAASGTLYLWTKAVGTPNANNTISIAPGASYVADSRAPRAVIKVGGSVASMVYEAAEA